MAMRILCSGRCLLCPTGAILHAKRPTHPTCVLTPYFHRTANITSRLVLATQDVKTALRSIDYTSAPACKKCG